ncbi:DUF1223 domain-containing protein [Chryseobacterium populi]|uniref:Putative secreted protein n=1 Tax=Chryseobacterium populi TaxID=1144316 RepID=J3CNR3_9FLAO|nr:DUF1223 domain-containing protein [Chryseobacterium populi]EJL75439.1 putative secreted protein [Chryseobacterium populi]
MISRKLFTAGALVALMFIISAFVQTKSTDRKIQNNISGNNGFAVLELFTSEGCSSCPPADALIGQINQEWKGKPVYILAYHVDYWNRLGWKDRFSTPENSERQQQYSRVLNSQVYTPQLIVNGKQQFVGSDGNAAENSISTALSSTKNIRIDLTASALSNMLNVHYKVSDTNIQNRLLITLVEKKSTTNVAKGENEGRHLIHWQIVRKQNQISLKNGLEGTTGFPLPENSNANDWEVIGFLQNTKTGEITGSAKVLFN